jgi:hypothetical protein
VTVDFHALPSHFDVALKIPLRALGGGGGDAAGRRDAPLLVVVGGGAEQKKDGTSEIAQQIIPTTREEGRTGEGGLLRATITAAAESATVALGSSSVLLRVEAMDK